MCIPAGSGPSTQTLGNVGLGLQVAGAFTSAVGSAGKAKADKQAYEYQAAVTRNNAQIDEWRAQDAEYRGAVDVNRQRLKTAALKGSQRARLAAAGVALDEGSALNILMDTDYMGALDAATIEDNTAREAWALRESAKTGRSNADMLASRAAAESPLRSAATSLLTSAGTVASSWYALRNKREATTSA